MRNKLCKEPGAEKPHAGICGGQASQGACLPDNRVTTGVVGLSPCHPDGRTGKTLPGA